MTGIEKCRILRQLRNEFCRLNGLNIEPEENCPHPNPDCKGTCPACDAKLRMINKAVQGMRRNGKVINYEGLSGIIKALQD